ncbi:MAG: quercetin 2,3-dioxygenase [Planctomycetales bacterium]
MQQRRTFLQSGLGVVALAAADGCLTNALAEEKPRVGTPKVVKESDGTKVWAMGVQVTVKVQSEETGGAYSAFEDLIPPGAGPVPHTHTKEDETIFVIDGKLRAWLGGKQFDVATGDFVHMPRGVQHYFRNVSDKPTRLLLSYTPGGFEQWFLDIGKPVADADQLPPEITPEDIKRAVAAAEKYGVKFEKKWLFSSGDALRY